MTMPSSPVTSAADTADDPEASSAGRLDVFSDAVAVVAITLLAQVIASACLPRMKRQLSRETLPATRSA
jgi:hypothetical protein